jgi:aminoglycoside 6'-N-acetyltransferase
VALEKTIGGFAFRPVAESDLPMLRAWLEAPHVRRWWGDPDRELAEISGAMEEAGVDPYIVTLHGRPIGYLQSYDPHSPWGLGVYRDQPLGSRGIDQFIGDADMIGRGHGPRFIEAICDRLFETGAPRVITDPDPANRSAIRAYQKAGFRRLEERTIVDGPVLLMARDGSS